MKRATDHFYMNPMGVAKHTGWREACIEMPESWYDLLKPEFKGEIQMPTPQSSGTAYNLLASLVLAWGEDEAFAYMKELNKNIQSYTQSGTAPSQAVAIGQAGVAIQFTPAFLKLIDEGYPLKLISRRKAWATRPRPCRLSMGRRTLKQLRPSWIGSSLSKARTS